MVVVCQVVGVSTSAMTFLFVIPCQAKQEEQEGERRGVADLVIVLVSVE